MILIQKRSDGFTLVELMVVVTIIGILSGFSIITFQRQWRSERLLSISRAIQGSLETWRKQAMQSGGPCLIKIESQSPKAIFAPPTDEQFALPVEAGSSTTKDVSNACSAERPLNLHTVETGLQEGDASLTVSPASETDELFLLFSFRGLSEAHLNEPALSTTPGDIRDTEFRIGVTGLQEQRCIKLLHPLGLIRAGQASTAQGDCSYQNNR